MRHQLLIGFVLLNIIMGAQAMERANFIALLALVHAFEPQPFVLENQSKQRRIFYDQPDKKHFGKIVHDNKQNKGYASEKRLRARKK